MVYLPDTQRRGIQPLHDPDLVRDAAALVGIHPWTCDLSSERLSWSDGVFGLFGIPYDASLEREDVLEFYTAQSRTELEALRRNAIRNRSGFSMEAQIRQPNSDLRWIRITASTRLQNGRPAMLYGVKQDITQEREDWDRLRKLAEYDPLTGLANRSQFQSSFLDLDVTSHSYAQIGGLVLFDLNNFKSINDGWGHAAGDACIAAFGQRLGKAFPTARLVSRIGGDEFAMVFPASVNMQKTAKMLRQQLSRLVCDVAYRGTQIPLGVSVGMAFADLELRKSPEALFMEADAQLYAAKRGSKQRLRITAA